MAYSLELFFFQSYNKCFISEMFSILVKSFSIMPIHLQCIVKKAFFQCFFKSCIDQQFNNLESGKRNYRFEKSLEKVVNFGSKICTNPVMSSKFIHWEVGGRQPLINIFSICCP